MTIDVKCVFGLFLNNAEQMGKEMFVYGFGLCIYLHSCLLIFIYIPHFLHIYLCYVQVHSTSTSKKGTIIPFYRCIQVLELSMVAELIF